MWIRNSLLHTYFARRMKAIDRFRRHPNQVQAEMFQQLIARAADTEFGDRHGVAKHLTPEAFAARVGVQDYESFKPYIERMLAGEKNVAARGRVTLSPVRRELRPTAASSFPSRGSPCGRCRSLRYAGRGGGVCFGQPPDEDLRRQDADARRFVCPGERSSHGDLSAVLISPTPFWSGSFRAPKMETALDSGFRPEDKGICRECTGRRSRPFPACLRGTWC